MESKQSTPPKPEPATPPEGKPKSQAITVIKPKPFQQEGGLTLPDTVFTATSLRFTRNLSLAEIRERLGELLIWNRATILWLGDLICQALDMGYEYEAIIEGFKLPQSKERLMNVVSACRNVSPSLRSEFGDKLSFRHFIEVQGCNPKEQRKLLKEAANTPLSCAELRRKVKALTANPAPTTPPTTPPEVPTDSDIPEDAKPLTLYNLKSACSFMQTVMEKLPTTETVAACDDIKLLVDWSISVLMPLREWLESLRVCIHKLGHTSDVRLHLHDQLSARQLLAHVRDTLPSEHTLEGCKDLSVLMDWLETWRILERWITTLNHCAEKLAIEHGNTPEAKAAREAKELPVTPVVKPKGKYIATLNIGNVAGFKTIGDARDWAEDFMDEADDCRITTRGGKLVARHRRMVGTCCWINISEGSQGWNDEVPTNAEIPSMETVTGGAKQAPTSATIKETITYKSETASKVITDSIMEAK